MLRLLIAALVLVFPLSAQARDWVVDRPHSEVTFTASQSGKPFTGKLPPFNAEIRFDPDKLDEASVSVVMPLAGLTTGDAARDGELPAAQWLDIEHYPEARYVSTSFSRVDATHFIAHGQLTLRGITLPVELPFELVITGNKAVATGGTSLGRLLFGIGQNWGANSDIGDRIDVKINLRAQRKAAQN
jgi:polyisoprenoid-binding protein YceI